MRQNKILLNLIILAYIWSAVAFAYYMVSFQLKYLPGGIYSNTFASCTSDIIAYICAGFVYKALGVRPTFIIGFLIGLLGSLLIVFLGSKYTALMPVFVLLAKFGISMNFMLIYVATVKLFPTLFCGAAFGICGMFKSILSILAPQVAEIAEPIPMVIYAVLCLIGALVSPFIIDKKN